MIASLYQKYLDCGQKITTDTRNIIKDGIFFALKGENFNGNAYAQQAIELGAKYVVIDEGEAKSDQYIKVNDVLATLQNLARHHRLQFAIPFIGITGTNGKTSCKELMACVLKSSYKTAFTQGNLNNHIGVPLTLLSIPLDTEIAIIEIGANHQHEIQFLTQISLPTHGIITNIGKAHLEGFGSYEGVKKAKSEMYDALSKRKGTIIYNFQDDVLKSILPNDTTNIPFNDDLIAMSDIKMDPYLSLTIKDKRSNRETRIQTQLFGNYNAINVLLAYTVGRQFNVSIENIQLAIESYKPSNNRSQIEHSKMGNTIVWDAYNANPSSMSKAIESFTSTSFTEKILILGEMRELGENTLEEHLKLIEICKQEQCFFVGTAFKKESNNTSSKHLYFEDVTQLSDYLKNSPIQNNNILIKGSRGIRLEKLKELL